MKGLTKKWLSLSMVICLVAMSFALTAEAELIFEDNFEGAVLDSELWNTAHATSGKRWCSRTLKNHHSNPGNWQDVSSEPCHSVTRPTPYGDIIVNNGEASFSAGYTQVFPYIWTGPPSRVSPFPESGDFVMEVRMKYDALRGHGDGFSVLFWENSDPVGDNPPVPAGKLVLNIWASTSGLRLTTQGGSVYLTDLYSYHTYRLEYMDSAYYLYVDGILTAGPTASALRPNTIWIGNPVCPFWGIGDWTDFTIDYIRVWAIPIPVSIDIKPGSDPNSINIDSRGVIPVAVLTTDDFDAAEVDPGTVLFGPSGAYAEQYALEDVDDDGDIDLILHFRTRDAGIAAGDTQAVLTAETYDGQRLEGSDSVRVLERKGKK